MRYAARVAYDGTAYFGWQRQREPQPTVQGAFEAALARVVGAPVPVVAAGRTDTGVHAVGQVVSFTADWAHGEIALCKALNAALPADIAVSSIIGDMGDFHARYSACARVYNYTLLHAPTRNPLLRERAWQLHGPLDMALAGQAAAAMLGTHDCAALGKPPQGDNTVRTIYRSAWRRATEVPGAEGTLWVYEVAANAFLLHMVRRMAGLMVAVAQGALTLEAFIEGFQRAALMRARLAPPGGLVFQNVEYPPAIAAALRGWQMRPPAVETGTQHRAGQGAPHGHDMNRDGEAADAAAPEQKTG